MRTTTLATALLLFVLLAPVAPAEQREVQVCGTYPSRGIAAAAQHRYLVERRDVSPFRLEAFQTTIDTTGDLVVIADDGLILAEANVFDLRGRSLSFEPSGESGYRVRSGSAQVKPALGDPQPIGDDATVTLELDFEFAYFGSRYSEVFLNSDGNLSFTRGDSASTERSLGRVLSGPPRIAVFFDDLDPSAGGEVLVHRSPDRLVVTWSRVPEWSKTLPNTFQVVLTADGRIETRYPDGINASSSVIGLSPGDNPETVDIVDLGGAGGESEGALLERFQSKRVVDNVALVALLAEHRRPVRTFAAFVFVFGGSLWDIFYYAWLKLLIDWPSSWLEWDVLFLIPWIWLGPWICPVLIALAFVVWGFRVLRSGEAPPLSAMSLNLFVAGSLLCLTAFLAIELARVGRAVSDPLDLARPVDLPGVDRAGLRRLGFQGVALG